ncbi:MAG: hypothetical protein EA416_07905 [Trueperaceae bacterium]|nr:MAG: hypothetical protein EA416_07905 [Trueperaceae bacterium]
MYHEDSNEGAASEARAVVDSVFRRVHVLRVAVLFNEESVQIRYAFPTDRPSWYHACRVFRGGAWRQADDDSAAAAPLASGLYEDRISIAIDDGSVPGFSTFGGYLVARPGTRSYPDEVPASEVEESFIVARGLGSDVRKYLPISRSDDGGPVWRAARSEDELLELRRAGAFLGTIQWRAHRSNPVGYADPGYVLEYRRSAGGRGMYADNWDAEAERPLWMFDPAVAGLRALDVDRLVAREYGQDDPYYLEEGTALPLDPAHAWRDGDALPTVYLRSPSGSRASVRASGRYEDGAWQVRLTRSLAAPDPLDGKPFESGRSYTVQFSVHTRATAARWHLVSMPMALGFDAPGTLEAVRIDGDLDAAEARLVDVPVAYPGIVTLEELSEDPVAGAHLARAVERPLDVAEIDRYLAFVWRHEEARSGGTR